MTRGIIQIRWEWKGENILPKYRGQFNLYPAGATSYNLGTVRNIEHYVMSNEYYINKTLYYVIN